MSNTDSNFEYYTDAMIHETVQRFTVDYHNGMKVNTQTTKDGEHAPERILDWYRRNDKDFGRPVFETSAEPVKAMYLELPDWLKAQGIPDELRVARIFHLFYYKYNVEDDRFKDLQTLVDQCSKVIPVENDGIRKESEKKLWSLIPQLIRENRLNPTFRLKPYHDGIVQNLETEIKKLKEKDKRRRKRESMRRQPVNQR